VECEGSDRSDAGRARRLPPPIGRRRVVIGLSVLTLSWPLAACQRATPTSGAIISGQALAQYPEYHLYYPGSTLIGQGTKDAETGPSGYSRANAGATLGTDATADEVVAFYTREIAARGWQVSDIDGVGTTSDLAAYGWRKGHVAFRVAILRPHDPRNPTAIDSYRTAYTILLTADDPRDPSWQSRP